jgi:DNA-directed RNA polymerase specialized sigma24 family protein
MTLPARTACAAVPWRPLVVRADEGGLDAPSRPGHEGDGGALEALYSRYGRACYGLARRILADEQLAQDAVQEVFLTVWRDASRFDASRGGFSTWLLSMTHHKAVDSVRREENLRKRRTTADALELPRVGRPSSRGRGLVAAAPGAGPGGPADPADPSGRR